MRTSRRGAPESALCSPATAENVEPGKIARAHLRTFAAALQRAAKHPGDAASIHRLRVSIRRFVQVLSLFDDCFRHTGRMRRRAKRLMDRCGAVRDCDIAAEVLAAAGVASAALEKSLRRLRDREERKLAELLTEMAREEHSRAGVRRWREWLTTKRTTPLTLPDLTGELTEAGDAAAKTGATFEQMHRFRLLVKKLRYTLEILNPDPKQLETLRALQERLGAISDCATTASLIEGLGQNLGLSAPEKRGIKMALKRLLAHRTEEFRVFWRANFELPKTSRRKK